MDMVAVDVETRGKRELQKLATLERILESARAAFAAQRYEDVTIRAIAKSIGMSTGAIFANFGQLQEGHA
jgi:AcrR family transcriptional regulator